ncbi:MAG: (deoxy)nucleoside triphosphate pyrophosphohydrolase [Bacteroidota bacterium]
MKEVAVGVVERGGKFLACQRRKDTAYPLKWEFPGGKIEPGESPADALRRELREELGIDAEIGEQFHRQEWTYPGSPSVAPSDGKFRVYYYRVRRFEGMPENRAFEQIRWVSLQELRGMDILEGNRPALDLLAGNGRAPAVS